MEFLVDAIQEINGIYHVTGICGSDSESIKFGDKFSQIYKKNYK
jgi:hypothetical protein